MKNDFNTIFTSRKYINDSHTNIYGGSWRCKMKTKQEEEAEEIEGDELDSFWDSQD